MAYERGIDIIVVGYHQPVDCREFHSSLFSTSDHIPWDAWYFSVEATREDSKVGNEVWGPYRHICITDNCGHAQACNYGASQGNHDTLFFCNADTRLPSGVMERGFESLWSDSS